VRETRFLSSAQVRHDREKEGDLYYDTDDDFIDDTVRPSYLYRLPWAREACVRGGAAGLCSTGLQGGRSAQSAKTLSLLSAAKSCGCLLSCVQQELDALCVQDTRVTTKHSGFYIQKGELAVVQVSVC
jgi:hypothetical protein